MFRDVPECSGMFRHVPECSGMFHVPGFIDGPFNTRRVTRGEMCVPEGFRSFKMCLYVKDRFFLQSCAFVYNRV